MLFHMLCESPTKLGLSFPPGLIPGDSMHIMPLKDCVWAGIKRSSDFVSY